MNSVLLLFVVYYAEMTEAWDTKNEEVYLYYDITQKDDIRYVAVSLRNREINRRLKKKTFIRVGVMKD
jgi:hypothetical protein